jgi:CRP-like cAMP-binding protein
MNSLDFLDQVEMFSGLSDQQLQAIQDTAESAEYKKGDPIFKHGQTAEYLWIVLEGELQLICESDQALQKDVCEPITFVSEAQTYGWHCFVPPFEYRLSGYCASRHCRLIRLKKEALERLFKKDPEIGFAVMQYTIRAIGTQFQELQDELARRRGQEILSNW